MSFVRWTSTTRIILTIVLAVGIIIIFYPREEDQVLSKAEKMQYAWGYIIPQEKNEDVDYEHVAVVRDFIDKRKALNFSYSELGKVLFLDENPPPDRNKTFKILMYKNGKFEEERNLYYFGGTKYGPFEFCPVKNCILTYNDTDFEDADAVLFHLHRFNKDYNTVGLNVTRHPWQRWVFTSDESAHCTFMMQPNHWYNYSGVFNWSMMYRLESDVPVAYGRVVPLQQPLRIPKSYDFKEKFDLMIPNAADKQRDVLVAVLTSNCWANKRMYYIMDLQKHIKVDVYGGCASPEFKDLCPFHGYGTECGHLRKYLFYLGFENGNCNGYITEKVYSHALRMGSVPVLMGMYEKDYIPLVPPNSYIHVDNFKNPEELAKFILHINATFEENYLKYHEWRKDFDVLSEDGYMGAKCYHYCRLCQALNYNDLSPRVYSKEDLAVFLDPTVNCHDALEWTN